MGEPAKPLPFRKPDQGGVEPRWNVGIDKKQVGIYVGLAVIAGFALGLATSRFLATPVPGSEQAAGRSGPHSEASTPVGGRYKVTRIVRADTLELEGLGPIRLLGVESPEGKAPEQIYLPHGRNAAAFTQRSLAGQEVRVEFDPSAKNVDGAEFRPAYVYTGAGVLFNSEIVRQGHAFVRANEQCQLIDQLRSAEREAMQAMRGVWGIGEESHIASSALASTPAAVDPAAEKNKKLRPLMPSELAPAVDLPAASTFSPSEPIVFVSGSDRLYHKEGCEYLAKKSQSVPLSKAKADGYGACGRCFASTVLKAP